MTTISLAMIVKNEEAVLGRVLQAASQFCSELIVVDTGSTDRTVEVAEAAGAQVHRFEWVNDFAAARNYAFSKCTGEWILWLDADDILTEETVQAGRELRDVHLPATDRDVVTAPYHYSYTADGKVDIGLLRERFLRRSAGHQWVGRIHECIDMTDIATAHAQAFVVRHAPTDAHNARKTGRNLAIFESYIDIQTASMHELSLYGSELHANGRSADAIPVFRRYLEIYPKGMRDQMDEKYITMVKLAEAHRNIEQFAEAARVCADAILWTPDRAEAYGIWGMVYFVTGQYAAAYAMFSAAVACKPPGHGGLTFGAFYGQHMHDMVTASKNAMEAPNGVVVE